MKRLDIETPRLLRSRRGRILSALTGAALMAALIAPLGVLATHPGNATTTWNVQPTFRAGNPSCSSIGSDATNSFKINAPGTGVFIDATTGATFTITSPSVLPGIGAGQSFDFSIDGGTALEVIVKGGPNANLYDYVGSVGPKSSDTWLHAPINHSNDTFYGLSHLEFCYNPGDATDVVTELHERTDSTGTTDVTPANNGLSISVPLGAWVNDVATVTPSDATGSVSFVYYASLEDCEADTDGTAAGTDVAVSGGTATSSTVQFNTPGDFYWSAWFTGTGLFNDSSSLCEEILTVLKNQPDLSTAPNVLPNDEATLTNLVSPIDGELVFELFLNGDCSGVAAYTSDPIVVTGAGPWVFESDNDSVFVTADAIISWIVTYSGDANNEDATSDCLDEQIDLDFTPLDVIS